MATRRRKPKTCEGKTRAGKPCKKPPIHGGQFCKAHSPEAEDWAPAFLAAFEETHIVTEACRRAGIGRSVVYERRDQDEAFREAWAEVEERSTELLEAEAYRRAAEGWIERQRFDLNHDGEQVLVEEVRKWSDTLLIFLLKARKPETYRERHQVQHTGPDGGSVNVEVTLDDESREAIAGVLRRRPVARQE